MDTCRTCLKIPAIKHISQLERSIKEDNRKFVDIMLFCLDIKVTEDSKITTNLCNICFKKIISFYKFKALSLKNDAYLRSLDPSAELVDQKQSVYVDDNGIKHENPLETDEYGPSLIEDCNRDFKVKAEFKDDDSLGNEEIHFGDEEVDVGNVSTLVKEVTKVKDEHKLGNKELYEELISVVHTVKDENINDKKIKQKATGNKRGRSKTLKPLQAKSKPKKQVCEECGITVLNLKQHSLQHQPNAERQKWQCKACPKVFVSRSGRFQHYRRRHLGQRQKCDICNKEVTSLQTHKKQVHNRNELPFGCVSCEKRFISRSGLESHMVDHTNEFPYECDACHKKYRSKMSISKHIRQVHEKEKLFQCHICSKAFFKKHSLQKHIWSHTKERPFACECGKSFGDPTTLKNHRLIHADVKSFRCGVCDAAFARKGNLTVHMLKHTKEKRYPCGFCGVRFGRSDHRNRHEFTAHKKFLTAD